MEDKNKKIINGANPSIIWTQYYDFLATFAKQMKAQYTKRMRENKPFTWQELDVMNADLHHKLDVIMSGNENVDDKIQESTNKGRNRRHISESQLRQMVSESIRRVLNETGEYEEFYQINISYPANGCPYAFVSRYSSDGYRGTTSGTRYGDGTADRTEWCVTTNSDKEYLEELSAEYNKGIERAYRAPDATKFGSIEHRLYTKIINS